MSKKLLIISFSMPPSSDIGVRRWVKFAKYLKQKGHLIKIIAAHEHDPETSPWLKDAECLEEDLFFTNSGYPKYLGIRPQNFKDKVLYRVSLHYAKLRSGGNYYDKSNLWGPQLLKASRETIKKHDIKNVICTIPPFKIAWHLLQLKKEFPHINFIVDYRDPWINNKTAFGFMHLSAARFQTEKSAEKKVVQQYDKIIAVSEQMKEHFLNFIDETALNKKFIAIPNGFDSEDFVHKAYKVSSGKEKGFITVTFAGTFYDKSIHVLEKLIDSVNQIKADQSLGKNLLKFIFLGSMPQKAKDLVEANSHSFTFLGKKNLHQTYELLANADYCSLFLTDDLNYSLSTKFYEYLAMQKPIISFSREKGANAKFIEKHGVGIGVDFSTMPSVISSLMRGETIVAFKSNIDYSAFDVKNLAKKVEDILI